MILIATKHVDLVEKLSKDLSGQGHRLKVANISGSNFLSECYHPEVSVIILDEESSGIPYEANYDLINSLGLRIPIIVVCKHQSENDRGTAETDSFTDHVTVLTKDRYEAILASAILYSGKVTDKNLRSSMNTIPYYNPQVPISMLRNHGGLGILTIDTSAFGKVSLEYGLDVYHLMKKILHDVLFNLWGPHGCIRENDVLCRRSSGSNNYLIFMSSSRESDTLPLPGSLEKVADRISTTINNAFWQEIFAPRNAKRIPECVQTVPVLGVGFFGVLNNPCIEIHEIIDSGLESSKQMAGAQLKRGKERQRELIQLLIQSEHLLAAHYQGVFYLQKIDEEMVKNAVSDQSMAIFKPFIFGFESLIRVNQEAVNLQGSFDTGVDSKYLRPDVLFSVAKNTNVALELDQACMRHAARGGKDLPGTLMVNILPRNLYYVDRLKVHLEGVTRIMFEVSESEAINNLDLMMKSRDHLEKHSMGIAADDFGKGYSSLERIIKIRPDVIKFDRGMIQDIDKDPVKQAYVQGLVTAAKILNTMILAEGVETWGEAEVLKEMGIELIQGFLLHRPQSVEMIEAQLRDLPAEQSETDSLMQVQVA